MNPFQHVKPGDKLRFSAASYNAMADAAKAHALRSGGSTLPVANRPGVVLVENNSGGDIDAFGVLAISGASFSETDLSSFKYQQIFTGDTPATEQDEGLFVVTQQPIKSGSIGYAVASGVTVVKVDMRDESHKYAEVTDDDKTKLTSGPSGSARILHVGSGTGDKWAWVRLGNHTSTAFPAKLTGETSGSYSWTEQTLDSSGDWTDLTDGRTGTTNAKEFDGAEGLYDASDEKIVWMIEMVEADDDVTYRFALPIPAPPAGPAILVHDATSGIHWLPLTAAYHGAFRAADGTMESTPQKATS
jgi:hypothetical protein